MRATTRGMTLVELMVGMAVGLFVVLVAVTIFISTRTLQGVGAASTRMSENGRLAMDTLQTDLRNASFLGCRPLLNEPPVSLLNAGNGAFLTTAAGLQGYRGTGAGFSPALIAPLAALPPASAPLPNSDILSVRVPFDPDGLGIVVPMASTLAAPQVAASSPTNTIAVGDIVLVASCKAAAMFQVTEPNPAATGVLTHGLGGGFVPGNAVNDLQQRFRTDATVYKMQTRHYFVAPSALHPGTNSLWRLSVPGAANPEEMASGRRPPRDHLRHRRRRGGGSAERRSLRRGRRRHVLGQDRCRAPADAGRDRQGRRQPESPERRLRRRNDHRG